MQTTLTLLQSETLFKTIYEESPIGIEIYDSDGRLIHANRACLQMFGIDDIEEVQGFNLFDDPNVPDKEKGRLQNGYPIKFEVAFDFEIVKKLGLYRTSKEGTSYLSVVITPLKSGDGPPQGYLVQVLDDTERKQAEKELKHSHQILESCVHERTSELVESNKILEREISQRKETERLLQEKNEILESIFSNIQFLAAYMDADFNFRRVNQAYADAAGHPPEFFVGKNHFELYPHAENEAIFRKVVETGEPYFVYEKAFEYTEYPERGVTYWDWSLHPVKEPTDKIKGVVLNLIDVTKRKQAEVALSSERQRLFSVLDKLPAFVRLQSPDYSIPFANQYFKDRFGNPEDRPCYKALHCLNEPCEICPTHEVFRTGRPVEWEWPREKNGRIYHVYDYPFHDYDGSLLVLQLGIDITERKHAEEQLEQRNRELQDFTNVASHDLQEPLRKIQAFGDRLKKNYGEGLGDNGLDYLERMQNAASRMQMLIDSLLNYSRISTKGRPFEDVNLNEVVREVIGDLEVRIEQAKAEVTVMDLTQLKADPLQMRQLFQNLIGNALKFHGDRPPKVQISGSLNRKNRYEISVKDNGIGFDQKHLDRIFRPFERLHGRSEYEGTGMGLAICRKIVERHGGTITARSKPGNGATFIVSLPIWRVAKSTG